MSITISGIFIALLAITGSDAQFSRTNKKCKPRTNRTSSNGVVHPTPDPVVTTAQYYSYPPTFYSNPSITIDTMYLSTGSAYYNVYDVPSTIAGPVYSAVSTSAGSDFSADSTNGGPGYPFASKNGAPDYLVAAFTDDPAYYVPSNIDVQAYSAVSITGAPASSPNKCTVYYAASTSGAPAYPALSTTFSSSYLAASTTKKPACPADSASKTPAYSASSTNSVPANSTASNTNKTIYSAASSTRANIYLLASTTNAPVYSVTSTINDPACPAASTTYAQDISSASTIGAPTASYTNSPAYSAASNTGYLAYSSPLATVSPTYSSTSITSTQAFSSASTNEASSISDLTPITSYDLSTSYLSTFITLSPDSSITSLKSTLTSEKSSSKSSTLFSSSESSTNEESSSLADLSVPTDIPNNVDFYDFQKGSDLEDFYIEYCPQNAVLANGNLELILTPECGTNIIYIRPMKTGKFETVLKMAAGPGAVTALNFRGYNKDEIDIEFVGKDNYTWQSMYFYQGNGTDIKGGFHSTPGTPLDLTADYHNYGLELLDDTINWYFDGTIVRTVHKTSNATFPSQAGDMIYFGIWNGGINSSGWAGDTDFSTGNKIAYMRSLKITHYS
ncbi:Extracellular glycosidase CRH11 [Smittium mucronatum]|uniref:Extracellular glycosidase CRH11 n=1 Tax=Smittium mucronatum TaxID=133383 RepID=A0A1R0GY55_9FUNG|nr:Extracellular glycosidase CRH11 [Smittium mucronatum]